MSTIAAPRPWTPSKPKNKLWFNSFGSSTAEPSKIHKNQAATINLLIQGNNKTIRATKEKGEQNGR